MPTFGSSAPNLSSSVVWTVLALAIFFSAVALADEGKLQQGASEMSEPPVPIFDDKRGKVRFLFVAGTEGTGHHFISSLVKTLYNSLAPKSRQELKALHLLLWNQEKGNGLFNFHCPPAHPRKHKGEQESLGSPEPVIQQLYKLRSVLESEEGGDRDLVVPLNVIATPGVGMMSYPNFGGECRALKYPDLDVLYYACDRAHVECSHLLVYREPYAVIRSTVSKRHFSDVSQQMKLMGSMVSVLQAQMMNQEKRRFWCWEYPKLAGSEVLGEALGWSEDEFKQRFSDIFQESPDVPAEEHDKIVPHESQAHMLPFIQTTEHLKTWCAQHGARTGREIESGKNS